MNREVTMKTVLIPGFLILCAGVPQGASASQNGRAMGGVNCNSCHNGGITTPTVTLTGPTTLTAGKLSNFTLTITGAQPIINGDEVPAGGLNVFGDKLAFAPPSTETRLEYGQLVHSAPKPFGGTNADPAGSRTVSFSFGIVPQATGTTTIYYAGNSVDGNGGSGGDTAAFGTIEVNIKEDEGGCAAGSAGLGSLAGVALALTSRRRGRSRR
jgi:hypothetical protein